MTNTTLNTNDKSSGVTLSGGNLTATGSGTGDRYVRATDWQTSGKFYFEFTVVALTGGDTGVGFSMAGASQPSIGATSTLALIWFNSGNVWVNGSSLGTGPGALQTGAHTFAFAVDFTNKKVWGRKDAGNWNNVAGNDPATNTGGYSISALEPGQLWPVISLTGTDAITMNFGDTAFAQSVPSGFTAGWPVPTNPIQLDPLCAIAAQIGAAGSSGGTFSLTTSKANSIVILQFHIENAASAAKTISSISDTAGLTWTKRKQFIFDSTTQNIEVWWAPAASILSADTVTVTLSGANDKCTCSSIALVGLSSSSPFDPNASLPTTGAAVSTSPSVAGVSTNCPNSENYTFAFFGTKSGAHLPAGSGTGYSRISAINASAGGTDWSDTWNQGGLQTTALSSATVTMGAVTSTSWGMVVDSVAVQTPTETGTGLLAIAGPKLAGAGISGSGGAGSLAIAKPHIAGAGFSGVHGTAVLAIAGPKIASVGATLTPGNPSYFSWWFSQ